MDTEHAPEPFSQCWENILIIIADYKNIYDLKGKAMEEMFTYWGMKKSFWLKYDLI